LTDIRALYSNNSLAVLYDELTMPFPNFAKLIRKMTVPWCKHMVFLSEIWRKANVLQNWWICV